MIRSVIIDDEPDARSTIRQLIKKVGIPVEVIGEADSVNSGKTLIERHRP